MRKTLLVTTTIAAIIAIPAGCADQKKSFSGRARISPQTHIASGRMLEAQQNYSGAASQYQQAIDAQPDLTIAYHRLAELYLKLGRFDEAGQVLRAAIEGGADEASMRNNLGYALMKMGRYDEAEQMLDSALAISPTFHRARMNLGLLHARAGRIDESIETFAQILPREDALYNVAVIRMHERDFVTAAWAFGEAVEIRPDFADARQQLEKAVFLARHEPYPGPEADILSAVEQTPAPTEPPVVAWAPGDEPDGSDMNVTSATANVHPSAASTPVAVATAPEPATMRDISTSATRPATGLNIRPVAQPAPEFDPFLFDANETESFEAAGPGENVTEFDEGNETAESAPVFDLAAFEREMSEDSSESTSNSRATSEPPWEPTAEPMTVTKPRSASTPNTASSKAKSNSTSNWVTKPRPVTKPRTATKPQTMTPVNSTDTGKTASTNSTGTTKTTTTSYRNNTPVESEEWGSADEWNDDTEWNTPVQSMTPVPTNSSRNAASTPVAPVTATKARDRQATPMQSMTPVD